jgi:hypothetical protein
MENTGATITSFNALISLFVEEFVKISGGKTAVLIFDTLNGGGAVKKSFSKAATFTCDCKA